jgi:hypothetical protein
MKGIDHFVCDMNSSTPHNRLQPDPLYTDQTATLKIYQCLLFLFNNVSSPVQQIGYALSSFFSFFFTLTLTSSICFSMAAIRWSTPSLASHLAQAYQIFASSR